VSPSPGTPPTGPALHLLAEAPRYLMHPDTLLAISVLAVALSLTDWVGGLPAAVAALGYPAARLLWACYFFLVARKASLGSRRLPVPADHLDTWDSLVQPLLRGLVATWLSWCALLVFAAGSTGIGDFLSRYQGHPLQFFADQRVPGFLVMALWLVQAPSGVIAALCSRSLLACADPSLGLRLARRTGPAYPVIFAALCALALVGHTLHIAGSRLGTLLPIPLAGPVLVHVIQLWVPMAQARIIGDFVCQYRPWLEAGPVPGRPR
jgi:hypothetical protein